VETRRKRPFKEHRGYKGKEESLKQKKGSKKWNTKENNQGRRQSERTNATAAWEGCREGDEERWKKSEEAAYETRR